MGAPHRGPDVGELPLPAERQKCFLLTSPESGRPGWNWHPRGQGTADQAAVRKNGTAKKMRADVSRSHFVVDLGFKASAYQNPLSQWRAPWRRGPRIPSGKLATTR